MIAIRDHVRRNVKRITFLGFLGALIALAGGAPSSAADGPFTRVELPGFRPGEATTAVVIATPISSPFESVRVALLNPAPPTKGTHDRYEVVADSANKSWRIEGVTKSGVRKPVARLTLESGGIAFRWEPGVTRTDGGLLRNVAVQVVDGSTKHEVVLRSLSQQPAWNVDLKKDISRFALGEDLPEESQLTLKINGFKNGSESSEIEPKSGSVKESCFIVLKSPDAEVPGARLRTVLWKSGIKPEVLVRPEMTPMTGDAAATTTGTSTGTGTTRISGNNVSPARLTVSAKQSGGAEAGFDPNKVQTMSFTTRGMTAIKSQLQSALNGAEGQLAQNKARIAAGENQLAKWAGGVFGTAEEIRLLQIRINQIESEIRTLSIQNRNLETIMLPNLKRQLWACPKMELLGNSLHGKAALSFRVQYELAGRPVDVLVVGEP